MRAIRHALDVGVAEVELVDALMSGDPCCELVEALDLLEVAARRNDVIPLLTAEMVRDLFGEDD